MVYFQELILWFQETVAELQSSPAFLLLPEEMQQSLEEFTVLKQTQCVLHVHFVYIQHMYILFTYKYMIPCYKYMHMLCSTCTHINYKCAGPGANIHVLYMYM